MPSPPARTSRNISAIPDAGDPRLRERLHNANAYWQWRRLMYYPKPTIAMVNGWCFGGAFQVLCACDLAVAADDAQFGLSEVNWGIIPAGIVTKSVAMALAPAQRALLHPHRRHLRRQARRAEIGLVNFSVPKADLDARTKALAAKMMDKNPLVLRTAKTAYHRVREMSWDASADYLNAKNDQMIMRDPEKGASKGMKQFLDEKSYKPGLGAYNRDK